MEKDAKRVDSHTGSDGSLPRSVDITGPDNDIRNSELLPIFRNNFILLDLREKIGVSTPRVLFHRAGLVQHRSPGLVLVGIDREGTHADNSTQAPVPTRCFEKVTRGDH